MFLNEKKARYKLKWIHMKNGWINQHGVTKNMYDQCMELPIMKADDSAQSHEKNPNKN